MKKIILMASMMVAVVTANAQARFEQGSITIQPRIGLTGAQLTNTPSITGIGNKDLDATVAVGLTLGVDVEYYLTDRVSFSGGIGLMQAGTAWDDFKVKENGVEMRMEDLKIESAYFTIPVTANWYVAKGFAVKAGVQAGFLTKGEMKYKASYTEDGTYHEYKESDDCKDGMKKFDLSIPVGLSYEFNFPLVIDARYNIGLTNVVKDLEPGEKNSRNGVFSLTVGYKFHL